MNRNYDNGESKAWVFVLGMALAYIIVILAMLLFGSCSTQGIVYKQKESQFLKPTQPLKMQVKPADTVVVKQKGGLWRNR